MTWILTHSGRHFDFQDPRPEDVHILDIVHALGNEPRFAGHTRFFYPVLAHLLIGSYIVPRGCELEYLLHDAHEAYIKDIPAPLKRMLPDYQAIEDRVAGIVRATFGLPVETTRAVRHADLVMLATERRDLMPHDPTPWPILEGIEPLPRPISLTHPDKIKAKFLARYVELTEMRRAA